MFNIFQPGIVKHQKLERIRTNNELRCIEIDRKLQKRLFDSFIRRKYYDRFKKLEIYEQYQQNLMNEKKQIKCYQSYGFHFRRDGKGRHYFVRGGDKKAGTTFAGGGVKALNDAQKYEENLTFHCIEGLLFTDDEIDIDKIITLHLITVQDNLTLMTSELATALSCGMLRRTSTKNLSTRRSKYVSLNSETINENAGYTGPSPRPGDVNKSPRCDKPPSSTIDQLVFLSSEQDLKKETTSGCGELYLNSLADDFDDSRSSRPSIGVTSTIMRGRVRRNILEKWFNSFPIIYILEIQKHTNTSRSNSIPFYSENTVQETARTVTSQPDIKRLLVNIKLIKLLNTVVASLQHGNPKKLEEILNRLQSQVQLKQMLKTQKISCFLRMLETKQFMLKPESYFIIDNIKNPVVYLQIDQYPTLEKFLFDMKESSGSETYRKSDSIKGSNWKLNLSTSQLSAQHKSSNKMIDPNESLHLLAANDSKLGITSGASIADYLSKRLRSNLQKHESEMRKLKQLKETVSDEILFNEKYFKTQHLPSVNPQSSYGLDDETVNEDPYYNALMKRDVQIVAKPFTIRQSSCYACLNKFRCKNVIPKIPTLLASKPSNWFESAKTHVNYYNCPSDVLFLNNNISYQSTDAINRILNNFIHNTENKGFGMYDEEPVLRTVVKKHEDSPPPTKRTLHGGRIAAGGTSPTLDTSSVAEDGVYCFPTQSAYSDQTFFRNSAWPLKLLNDNELYTMVFKDVNLKKLEERIAKIEVKKRLDKFLNSP